MTASNEESELKDRLCLIESMIAEGRRSIQSYGWTFVLWGVAYYVAILWSNLCHYGQAWPITMFSAGVLTGVIRWRTRCSSPITSKGRALWSIWLSMGLSMFILLDALGFSSMHMDARIMVAVASTLIATANAASSLILKWKLQLACAIVWWAVAVVSCYGTVNQCFIAFLTALFLCQIVFGIYLMIRESIARRQEATHA